MPDTSDPATVANLRAVLDHITTHQLPHRYIAAGCGGPDYIDIGTATWDDTDTWASTLGGTPEIDDNGRRVMRVSALGLRWCVYSDEKRAYDRQPIEVIIEDVAVEL